MRMEQVRREARRPGPPADIALKRDQVVGQAQPEAFTMPEVTHSAPA
jgi:hypothetical protein